MQILTISSPSFPDGALIPVIHTGYGADQSPELVLHGLCEEAVSLAVILNDMDHPIPAYNHWVIWNIPRGAQVPSLSGAIQGIGYGRHAYRGPKPPFHWSHTFQFTVYVLDTVLTLPPTARKKHLLAAMEQHILQQAVLRGHYR